MSTVVTNWQNKDFTTEQKQQSKIWFTVRNERKQSDVEETHSKQWFSIDKMIRSTCIQHI